MFFFNSCKYLNRRQLQVLKGVENQGTKNKKWKGDQ